MNNNEEFVRLCSAIMNSLANFEAHSDLSRTNRAGHRENVERQRPPESSRRRKMKRVKRQRVSKSSHRNLSEKKKQRDLIRSKLETLIQITPNCPKSDIICILDRVIEYMNSLQLAVFLTAIQNSV